MRMLGLDVGDRNIGVALSDETGTIASGQPTLQRVGPKKDLKMIAALVREHGVEQVVVGLPLKLDGSAGVQATKVLELIDALKARLDVPVVPWDERLTTVAAQGALIEGNVSRRGRKKVIDKVAAVLILQNYLDYRHAADAEARGAVI